MWFNLYARYSWFAMNIKFISPIVIFYFDVQKVQTFFLFKLSCVCLVYLKCFEIREIVP